MSGTCWVVTISDMQNGVPVEIIGPYQEKNEAHKMAERIRLRARQMGRKDIAKGIHLRLVCQHEGTLEALINKI